MRSKQDNENIRTARKRKRKRKKKKPEREQPEKRAIIILAGDTKLTKLHPILPLFPPLLFFGNSLPSGYLHSTHFIFPPRLPSPTSPFSHPSRCSPFFSLPSHLVSPANSWSISSSSRWHVLHRLPLNSSLGRLALRAANVLALHPVAFDDHNAAAPAALVPTLSAPAAVPAPVLCLKGTVRQRAFGCQQRRGRRLWIAGKARRCRVWQRLLREVVAGNHFRLTM